MIAAVLSGVMRSTGHARSPMVATLVTVLLNTSLGYCLVFGVGPVPGAGRGRRRLLATLVTASLKAGILRRRCSCSTGWSAGSRRPGCVRVARLLGPVRAGAAARHHRAVLDHGHLPLQRRVPADLGDDALAAAQIAATLECVFIVGSIGLMAATTALVGREVGRGDGRVAMAWVRRVKKVGLHTGVAFGVLFGAQRARPGPALRQRRSRGAATAPLGIALNALFQVVKVRNMVLGAGVLPSGDDVRGVILGDVAGAFVVGLPLAVVLGLHTPLGVAGVFVARVIEEVRQGGDLHVAHAPARLAPAGAATGRRPVQRDGVVALPPAPGRRRRDPRAGAAGPAPDAGGLAGRAPARGRSAGARRRAGRLGCGAAADDPATVGRVASGGAAVRWRPGRGSARRVVPVR